MKKEVYPKILVISHNPFSKTQNNGKTLAAFFKDWPSNKLAQLFLTLDRIDTDVCDSFYRISDVEVLKAWVKHNNNYGNEINKDTVESFNDDKTTMHQNKLYILVRNLFQKRLPLSMIFRSFVWNRVKPWKNDKLNRWIEQEKPELIFFQSSNVYAIYDMVYYISKRYNIPIIMETTDDYVTYSFSLNPFKYLNIYLLRKKYKKLDLKCNCFKNNTCKVGFPVNSLEKYIEKLNELNYSYIVYDINKEKNELVEICSKIGKQNKETNKNINCLTCKGLNKYKEDKYILAVLKTFEKD